MSDQSNISDIELKISEFIQSERFCIADNFPRNSIEENEIILKSRASLLIYSAVSTGRFAPFMRTGIHEGNSVIIDLKDSIVATDDRCNGIYKFEFGQIVFYTGQCPGKDKFGQSGPCRLKINEEKMSHYQSRLLYSGKIDYIDCLDGSRIFLDDIIKEAVKEFSKRSIFDYCCDYSHYNTPEKVCRFFNNPCSAYSPLKLASNTLRIDHFSNQSEEKSSEFENLRTSNPKWFEGELIQDLKSLFLNLTFEKYYGDWLKQVYSFENEHGEVVQNIIRIFDHKTQSKCFIPCTSWIKDYQIQNEYFCVPLPQQQILYNLNLIKAQKAPVILLTDSIEIADRNKHKRLLPGIIWTSWLCDESSYDQVDWTPLHEAQDVYYLITNHSGDDLAQAYLNAHKVASYLINTIKINLKFIQCEVDFKDKQRRCFENINDIINYRIGNKPVVMDGSVKIMQTFAEFEEIYKKAKEYLCSPRKRFYAADAEQSQTANSNDTVEKSPNKKLDAINYLMRPIIDKGGLCLLHAPSGLGKSSFSYSLCASIVAVNNKFISGKWWTVPKGKNVPDDEDDLRKVLYLDFELGKDKSDRKRKTFAEPYFSNDSFKRKKCDDNFIIEDLFGNNIKFLESDNHQIILNYLKEAEKQGVKDQPVDLIVFDTLTKLVGTEHSETWNMLEPLINKIRDYGTAVLIITHSTPEGKSRGFVCKDDSLTAKIKLSRENGKAANLEVPILVEIEKATDTSVGIDFEPFHVQFLNKKWRVFKPTKDDLEEYGLIVEDYTKDYSRDAITQMMGIEKSMHSDRMKVYEEKYKKKSPKK